MSTMSDRGHRKPSRAQEVGRAILEGWFVGTLIGAVIGIIMGMWDMVAVCALFGGVAALVLWRGGR